jgi:hypothetical protein
VRCKEIHLLLAPIFLNLEVLLCQAANDLSASVANDYIDIDKAAVELNGSGVGEILFLALTRPGDRENQARDHKKTNHASHRL